MKKTLHALIIAILLVVIVNPSFAQSKADIAKQSLLSKKGEVKLTSEDIINMKVSSLSYSKKSGLTHVYFQQQIDNIPIHNAILSVHLDEQNEIAAINSRFIKDAGSKTNGNKSSAMTAEEALESAAAELGYKINSSTTLVKDIGGPTQKKIFENPEYSLDPIPVELVYHLISEKTGETKLAWEVTFFEHNQENWWCARVDATAGNLLDKNNFIVNCNFGSHDHSGCTHDNNESGGFLSNLYKSFIANMVVGDTYNVFAFPIESPLYGARSLEVDPANPIASPFGWHDTDGIAGADHTITRGNNVWAQEDRNGNNGTGYSPDGTAALHFDFPFDPGQAPIVNEDAAITNLFYWNNILHDFLYEYGFDEAAGNFQQNNYGNGGLGNDFVFADAQNPGNCNANFGTPPDGANPRMQMFICNNTNPARDGDFDNEVIAHEYGHGVSNRLTGGPNVTGCLSNAEQMGEGWSDWLGLMITWKPTDVETTPRGIGEYLFGQGAGGPGIRPNPYTTDMGINPSTYADISGLSIPHGVGYVWATMLWDLNWALINEHGTAVGFDLSMNLVMEGMKLQPCNPGFVDGRDAIIAADVAMNGGANQCLIWEVFARRGLGWSADQGSSNSTTDGVEAFDMPPSCIINATPATSEICTGDDAVYTINVGDIFTNPVTLSATGQPAGSTVSFSSNPINAGQTSDMTVTNTGGVTPGTYTITVTGNDGIIVRTVDAELIVYDLAPAAPVLVAPANAAVVLTLNPSLSWQADPNVASYEVEVATDAGFGNIVASANGVAGINWIVDVQLNSLTTYHWRVRGSNSCGTGSHSATRTFDTGDLDCQNFASTNVPVPIGTVNPNTVTSTLIVQECGTIIDLNVTGLDISHTAIVDLDIYLTSPTGTIVQLMNRPCGNFDDILINFDDLAASGNIPCPATDNGTYQAFQPLSAFNGEELVGTWTLTVADRDVNDGGSINNWSFDICYVPSGQSGVVCYRDNDNDNFGDPNNVNAFCDVCPAGWVGDNTDCDDNESASNPDAIEICDFIDNNCDGIIDEGFQHFTCYIDGDNDGFGNPNIVDVYCDACPAGWVLDNTDCNDNNGSVNPSAPEICDGLDNDCDGITPATEVDNDGDGVFVCDGDCDDNNPNVWVSCGNCVDADGDGFYTGCDSYTTVFGPDGDDNDPNYSGVDCFEDPLDYSVAAFPFSYTSIVSTGAIVVFGDDVGAGAVTLGKNFPLYGTLFSQLNPTTNGYITTDFADNGPDLSNDCPLPAIPSTPGGTTGIRIYPFHDDLQSDPAQDPFAGVYYQYFPVSPYTAPSGGTMGASVFQWISDHYPASGTADIDFQAVLFDNGEIVYLYNLAGPEMGGISTSGIQSAPPALTFSTTISCNAPGSVTDNSAVALIPNGLNPGFAVVCYLDSDGDGFGDPNQAELFCSTCGVGYVSNNEDCNDSEADTYPGAAENESTTDCMKDADGDGFGDDNPPAGAVAGTDCDDNNPNIYPGVILAPINPVGYQICPGGSVPAGEGLKVNTPFNIPTNFSNSSPIVIPVSPAGTFTGVVSVPYSFSITDINVDLQITHTWVGDLKVSLTAPDGTTMVQLFDQPGGTGCSGCSGDNLLATFDDEAVLTAVDFENSCDINADPAVVGTYQPIDPLTIFNGLDAQGDWTLTVTDACGLDGGQVDSWTLIIDGYELITWWDAPTGGNQVAAGSPFDPTSLAPANGGVDPNHVGTHNYWAQFESFPSCATNQRVQVDFQIGLINDVVVTNETCAGAADGTFTIETTNPFGGQIGYSIDNGANFQFGNVFQNLTPGIYSVLTKIFGGSELCETIHTAEVLAGSASTVWYKDFDGDEYSDGNTQTSCSQPMGYIASPKPGTDCNDSNPNIYPGAPELCDGLDNDCNGIIPANEADADGDGQRICEGDCDDTNAAIYVGASEICDGLDNDCNGQVDDGVTTGTYNGSVTFYNQADLDNWPSCYDVVDGSVTIMGSNITNLGPLSNIVQITGSLSIYFNGALTSLNGLDNITTVGGSLTIYYNFALSNCCAIDDLLTNGGVGAATTIFFNAYGSHCNSASAIMAACPIAPLASNPNTGTFNVEESLTLDDDRKLQLLPNPASNSVTLVFERAALNTKVQVRDLLGRTIFEQELEEGVERLKIDLDNGRFGNGLYLISLYENGEMLTKQLVVQQ